MKVTFKKKYKDLNDLTNDLDSAKFIIPKRYFKDFKINANPLELTIVIEYAKDEAHCAESYFPNLKQWGFQNPYEMN